MGNYVDQSGTAEIVLTPEVAAVFVWGYRGAADGLPHGAFGFAIGANDEDLSAQLDFGEQYTDAPGGLAHWTFSGGPNYTDQQGTVMISLHLPPPDSSDVDAALMAKLSADPALMALMPNGVYWGIPTTDATKFVVVSHVEHGDAYVLTAREGWERFVYLVKAVTRGSSGTEVKQAAHRIHVLLQDTTLTVPGYHPPMVVQRLERVRYPEVDEATNERWQHRGGQYEVLITPLQP